MAEKELLLEAVGLKKYYVRRGKFSGGRQTVKALDGVDLKLYAQETVGVVGESGCGKTTLGRTILRLTEPTEGSVFYRRTDICSLKDDEMRQMRQKLQIIFQDPYSSLNPRMTVLQNIRSPLDAFSLGAKEEREARVLEICGKVSIDKSMLSRYPHEFSGGQRQRIVIARALISNPEFVVCDEPVSALDVSVRSQVLNLLKDLQNEMRLTYLFISHDLSVIRHISNRIAVMYLGSIVEFADKKALFDTPAHPYTEALLSSIPVPDVDYHAERIVLQGDVPSPIDLPAGCKFCSRCPYATEACKQSAPALQDIGGGHLVACHRCQ